MFIFDRCRCSSTAVTPLKYECDSKNLNRYTYLCKIENFAYREINEQSLVTPTPDHWIDDHWIVMPHGDTDLGQHWLRSWLVTGRHQAITWTNVDLLVKFFSIHGTIAYNYTIKIAAKSTRDQWVNVCIYIVKLSNRSSTKLPWWLWLYE